jgi:hypothetical protein
MKVRIKSGDQAGAVVELPRPEAEAALSTGYAEAVVEEAAEAEDAPAAAPKSSRRGQRSDPGE